jgi:hypothetical protein
MDLYKRRKLDWINQAKVGGGAGGDQVVTSDIRGHREDKSGIELARERFAAAKAKKVQDWSSRVRHRSKRHFSDSSTN